jgi:hypothetical protein
MGLAFRGYREGPDPLRQAIDLQKSPVFLISASEKGAR